MNIQELETPEITRLIVELNTELQSRIQAEKDIFLNEIRDKANSFGLSLDDLFEEVCKPKKRKIGKIQPKYQNPENNSETWTGRGYKPKWMKALLEDGKRIEDLLV